MINPGGPLSLALHIHHPRAHASRRWIRSRSWSRKRAPTVWLPRRSCPHSIAAASSCTSGAALACSNATRSAGKKGVQGKGKVVRSRSVCHLGITVQATPGKGFAGGVPMGDVVIPTMQQVKQTVLSVPTKPPYCPPLLKVSRFLSRNLVHEYTTGPA